MQTTYYMLNCGSTYSQKFCLIITTTFGFMEMTAVLLKFLGFSVFLVSVVPFVSYFSDEN